MAIVGALSYPVLLLFVFGASHSPLGPDPSWGLAAEHGELGIEHWSQFMAAMVSAIPLAVASRFVPRKVALWMVLAPSLATALLYAMQPSHPFESNDSWLANCTWPLAALGVALAPSLLAASIWALARLRGAHVEDA